MVIQEILLELEGVQLKYLNNTITIANSPSSVTRTTLAIPSLASGWFYAS